jgi:hypothetical protein
VAPTPAPAPEAEAAEAPDPAPAVSETPAEAPVVVEEARPETVPEETGDVLRTEATEDQDEPLGPTASVRPRTRPDRSAAAETPAESPPETPAEAPETVDPEAEAIAAALAEAVSEAGAGEGAGATDAPQGPPLTAGEIGDMRFAVQSCWTIGSVSTEAMSTVVTVRVTMNPDGTPDVGTIRMTGFTGGSDAAAQVMFRAARSAIVRCTREGYPLPPEKYDQWRDLELVFDPNGMRLR